MWFGDVEIPSELVDAHRTGDLVLFVGAGASRDAPSGLPDFRALTSRIAADANFETNDNDLEHPDVVLGHIEGRGVDVHHRVRELLDVPASSPNGLHRAIIDLGLATPHQRIVTTNFDQHLSSALADRGIAIEEYNAPALPVGDNFTGVVHLHGSLAKPADRMVVTDSDFGKAYLQDAWAARFLERMFATFSVLFLGYSHGDVVMRYLARALGPDGKRYVLTHDPESRDWHDLGLQPIGYQVDGTSHVALGNAIARWAEVAGMGLLDHRKRVTDLVALPPSGIPEETSYLEEIIADPVRVTFFTGAATTLEWLDWAAKQPVFKQLFAVGLPPGDTQRKLADWFVRRFVIDEMFTQRALQMVLDNGGHVGAEVCDELGSHLGHADTNRSEWLGVWLVLLVRDAPTSCTHWLEAALTSSSWPEHREQVLLLFDHLIEPVASLANSFSPDGPMVDIAVRGNRHSLQAAWHDILEPNLDDVANDVVALADRHLRRASSLRLAAHRDGSKWVALSYARNAIEPHPQDRFPKAVDVLIDAARDGIEALLDASDPIAPGYLSSWANSNSMLLRRLAVHGWSHRSDVEASAKLDWVVSSGWLFDYWLRHELFQLIAAALPDASADAIESLVDAVRETAEGEPDYLPYERFELLAWMNRARPDEPHLAAALEAVHAIDPTWQARDDPNLTHSIEVGWVPSRPPMSVEEFHDRLRGNPQSLLADLRNTKKVRSWEGEPTWDDSVALITSSVMAEPVDGFLVLDADSEDVDVVRAVIDGWNHAALDDELATGILDRIATLGLDPLVKDIAWMLSSGGRVGGYPTTWSAYPAARQLSLRIWPLISVEDGAVAAGDWLDRAINHPAGNVAEFWVDTVQYDWQVDENAWTGLSGDHRHALKMMLTGPVDHVSTQIAEVICASRFNLLFAADDDWAIENVLPLFDWTAPTRAMRAWASFTAGSRWNDGMLDAGLMECFLETVTHLDAFESDQREPILGQLAGIALTGSRDPLDWLPGVITTLNERDRVLFADKIAEVLANLPEEAVEHQWHRWAQEYWTKRLESVPLQLSFDEATAMAEWVPSLTTSFESGVDLVVQWAARFREHDDILRRLDGKVATSADECARMIGHLMKGTKRPWWGDLRLEKLMTRLRAASSSEHITVIDEEGLRLGFDLT